MRRTKNQRSKAAVRLTHYQGKMATVVPGMAGIGTRSSKDGIPRRMLTPYLKGIQALDIEPPYAVMVSLIGVRGVHIYVDANAA